MNLTEADLVRLDVGSAEELTPYPLSGSDPDSL